MKYSFAILIFALTLPVAVIAQPTKKTAPRETIPSQSDINKMMEDAMKDLSPEEKKQVQEGLKMAEAMQKKGPTGNFSSGSVPVIPAKQTRRLSAMRSLTSKQQYDQYVNALLNDCKKNIDPSIVAAVDKYFSTNNNDREALINLAPVMILQKNPTGANYAALKIAMMDADNVLIQDNLAVVLHQTGYPEKALPILQFLLTQNNYPIILNNVGQSYLSLGDTTNARKYFMACLKLDPDHSDANCGMALLHTASGRTHEATPYIIKSLRNGYTETADALLTKNKVKIKFSDIRQQVPEYFNPQQYKPVPPAYKMEDVEPTEALRTQLHEQMQFWMQKRESIHDEASKKSEQNIAHLFDPNSGLFSNGPFAKKAKLMVNLLGIEYGAFMAQDYKNQYMAVEIENNKQLQQKLTAMYGGGQVYENEYQECQKKIAILNTQLLISAKNHEAYQRQTLPKVYDWVNQSLYWWYFLMGKEQYKVHYHYLVSDFFTALHDYDQMQNLHPTPLWISTTCKNVKEPTAVPKKPIDSLEEMDCPVKLEIPLGIAKGKLDCKTFEVEGGELILLGFEKDFKSGEMTFFLGLGVGLFAKGTGVGGIEGSAKIGSFLKVGSDGTIIDMGNKGEAGVEGGIGPLITEAKITGVMGMQSGINVNVTGQKEPIYSYGTEK